MQSAYDAVARTETTLGGKGAASVTRTATWFTPARSADAGTA